MAGCKQNRGRDQEISESAGQADDKRVTTPLYFRRPATGPLLGSPRLFRVLAPPLAA